MSLKFYGAALAAAMLTAGSASAATMAVDTFTTAQQVYDTPTAPQVNQSVVSGAGILGGYRDAAVQNLAYKASSDGATTLKIGNGTAAFSNDSGARGITTITYDGDSTVGNVNSASMIANFQNSAGSFYFDVDGGTAQFDHPADFTATIWDTSGHSATYTETLQAGFNPTLYFNQFTGYQGIDFQSIGALQFSVASTNTGNDQLDYSLDGALNGISVSTVPVPAGGILLLTGLGALGFARRRSQKKAA